MAMEWTVPKPKKVVRKWYYPLLCLIGIHGKAKVDIQIVAVRYESHAIDYVHSYVCERCGREVPEPESNY